MSNKVKKNLEKEVDSKESFDVKSDNDKIDNMKIGMKSLFVANKSSAQSTE